MSLTKEETQKLTDKVMSVVALPGNFQGDRLACMQQGIVGTVAAIADDITLDDPKVLDPDPDPNPEGGDKPPEPDKPDAPTGKPVAASRKKRAVRGKRGKRDTRG